MTFKGYHCARNIRTFLAKHEKPQELEVPFQEQLSNIFFSAFDSNIKDHLSHILTNIYLDSLSESVARTYSKYQTGSCRIGAVED